ncbi:unnamed protein product [Caenorhabditis auriculariae]|uniref:Uncharacterized protein n=1 Tax=Caenorhabditis auriculariae TaxID=2777116 RepID=A0A8S1H0I5_9PELO|nr:unnamed protein product [Caenorhabditis auriculariae]
MAPVYLFPVPAVYASGYFRDLPVEQFHVFWTNCALLHLSTFSLCHLFWYRMKTMMAFTSYYKKASVLGDVYMIVTYAAVFTIYPVLRKFTVYSMEERLEIAKAAGSVPEVFFSEKAVVFDMNTMLEADKLPFLFMGVCGFSLDLAAFFVLPICTAIVLKTSQKAMSKRTHQMHRTFLLALFFQTSVHTVLLSVPVVFTQVANLVSFSNPAVVNWMVFMNTIHGSAGTFTMLMANPQFRNSLVADFQRVILRKQAKVKPVVSTTQATRSVVPQLARRKSVY